MSYSTPISLLYCQSKYMYHPAFVWSIYITHDNSDHFIKRVPVRRAKSSPANFALGYREQSLG